MNSGGTQISDIGWCFDNTYARLPKIFLSKLNPEPIKNPKLIVLNYSLAKELGLNFSQLDENKISSLFSGNELPRGSEAIAQAYAGHQFGYLSILGDGRAILIGEHLTLNKNRVDIQFKGSGLTPYSRGGDGKATLGPMLREYIISEAMHALKIPTTRSLAVVTTGQRILRDKILPGAILTRVASSHIRVGTFQYLAIKKDLKNMNKLIEYSMDRHYPKINIIKNKSISLLESVLKKQLDLTINWMRVGFIHGVMNTDNMTISGETIDYGPCAFMDTYDPKTVFSSIDHQGRYSYINQPIVTQWNLARFAETLIPFIDNNEKKAINIAEEIINSFDLEYKKLWLKMMREKIGLFEEKKNDDILIKELLSWIHKNKADYTNTFCYLMNNLLPKDKIFENIEFINWLQKWKKRLLQNKETKEASLKLMHNNNPMIIPRNHNVEKVLSSAVNDGDYLPMDDLIEALKDPYKFKKNIDKYQSPPIFTNQKYQTFCGT